MFVTPTWTTVGDTGISAKNKEPGPGADPDASDELLIYVDRQTRWAELIELMRTAHAQGDTGFSLVAEHADDIQGLPVLPPPLWSHDGGHIFDREPPRPEVTFVIETDAVRVSELEGRILLTELDRLAGIARRLPEPKTSIHRPNGGPETGQVCACPWPSRSPTRGAVVGVQPRRPSCKPGSSSSRSANAWSSRTGRGPTCPST
ncbi:MAG: hypothetical protein R6X02_11155 [Enhygromyxa sp.]